MTTVSVILPTYNRLPYLRAAVASVLAQTCCDWELIVADDGSTDATLGYLAELRDPRIVGARIAGGPPARSRELEPGLQVERSKSSELPVDQL